MLSPRHIIQITFIPCLQPIKHNLDLVPVRNEHQKLQLLEVQLARLENIADLVHDFSENPEIPCNEGL